MQSPIKSIVDMVRSGAPRRLRFLLHLLLVKNVEEEHSVSAGRSSFLFARIAEAMVRSEPIIAWKCFMIRELFRNWIRIL